LSSNAAGECEYRTHRGRIAVFHSAQPKVSMPLRGHISSYAERRHHLHVDFPRKCGSRERPLMVISNYNGCDGVVSEEDARAIVNSFANEIFPAPAVSTSTQVVAA